MAAPPGLAQHHQSHHNNHHAVQDSYGPPASGIIHPSDNFGPPPPQPPSDHYGPPSNGSPPKPPSDAYGPPKDHYGPPPNPSDQYGPPKPPSDFLGPPKDHYGAPSDILGPPKDHYGPPKPPSDLYGPPSLNDHFGPPPSSPSDHYGPPKPLNDHYGPPKPPNDIYGPPKSPPSDHYGPPKLPPKDHYGPPKIPSDHYGPPKLPPSDHYGPPKPPKDNYGPPKPPSDNYGPPKLPNDHYGPPKPPSDHYGPPSLGDHYGPPNPSPGPSSSGGDLEHYGPPKSPGDLYGPPPIPLDLYGPPKPFKTPSETYGGPPPPIPLRKPWAGSGPRPPRFGVKVNYPSEFLIPPPGDSFGSHSDKRPSIQRPPPKPIPLQPPPPPPPPPSPHPKQNQPQLSSEHQQENQVQQTHHVPSDNGLEIFKSVQVADYLSSVEYPLEIIQSQSYIDIPTKAESSNQIQTANEVGSSSVIGSASGLDSSIDNDKEGEIIMGKPFPGGPSADAPIDTNGGVDQKEASSQVEQAAAPSSLSLSSSSSSSTSVTIQPSIQTSHEHLKPPPPAPSSAIIHFGPNTQQGSTLVHFGAPQPPPPPPPSGPGILLTGGGSESGSLGFLAQGGTRFQSSLPSDIHLNNNRNPPENNPSSGSGSFNLHSSNHHHHHQHHHHQQELHHHFNQHASTALGGTIVHSQGAAVLNSNSIVPDVTVIEPTSLQGAQLIHTINGLPAASPVGYVPFQAAPQLPPAPFSFLNPPVTTAATSDYTTWNSIENNNKHQQHRHTEKHSKDIHQVIVPYTTSHSSNGELVASSSSSSSVSTKQHLLRFRFLNDEHKQAINTVGWAPVEEEITARGPPPLNCSHIFGENRRKQWRKGRLCIGFHGDSDEQESRPATSRVAGSYKNGKTLHEVLANNIRELLRSETAKGSKPPTIDKLRNSIDDWTAQGYKRLHGSSHEGNFETTIGYTKSLPHLRLPSKTIPDEYLTTEPSIFDDEPRTENTVATAVPAEPHHSASGSEWNAVLESNFVESADPTISPLDEESAEAEAATTEWPNTTPSTSTDDGQWVSLSVRHKEKVFVVTPQPGNLLSHHRPIPQAILSPLSSTTSHPPLSINDVFPFRGSDSGAGATSPSRFAVRPAPLPRVGSNTTTEALPTYTPPDGARIHTDSGHSRVVTATSSPRTRSTRGLSSEDDDLDDFLGFEDEDDSSVDEDTIARLQSLELHKNKH